MFWGELGTLMDGRQLFLAAMAAGGSRCLPHGDAGSDTPVFTRYRGGWAVRRPTLPLGSWPIRTIRSSRSEDGRGIGEPGACEGQEVRGLPSLSPRPWRTGCRDSPPIQAGPEQFQVFEEHICLDEVDTRNLTYRRRDADPISSHDVASRQSELLLARFLNHETSGLSHVVVPLTPLSPPLRRQPGQVPHLRHEC
jgi:hypothetical protein